MRRASLPETEEGMRDLLRQVDAVLEPLQQLVAAVQCWWGAEVSPGGAMAVQGGPLRKDADRLYAQVLECRSRCSALSLEPLLPFLGFTPQAAGIFRQRLAEFIPSVKADANPFDNAQVVNWAYDMERHFHAPLVALRQRIVSRLTGAPRLFEVRRCKPSTATVVLTPDGEYFVSPDVGVFLEEVFRAEGGIVSMPEVNRRRQTTLRARDLKKLPKEIQRYLRTDRRGTRLVDGGAPATGAPP